jgi:hypothetical protein
VIYHSRLHGPRLPDPRQRGKWAYYRIVDDALTFLALAITPQWG